MVEGGNVLHHVKREGELSGTGECLGNMSAEGICPGEVSGSPLCKSGYTGVSVGLTTQPTHVDNFRMCQGFMCTSPDCRSTINRAVADGRR